MPITLNYHDTVIEIPDPPVGEINVLEGKAIEPVDDPIAAVTEAINNPIESPSLAEMIPDSGDITIMVSDRTRKTRLDILLPPIVDCLEEKNVSDGRIKILVCLGTHKKHTREQLESIIPVEYLNRFEIMESHQENPDDFVDVGITPSGTNVRYHSQAMNSSLLICTGGITFHYFAGFSGGRKLFLPGISHVSSIQANHRMTYIEKDGEFVRNPACKSTALDGNPVSDDMDDAFHLMPVESFLVNVILNPQGEVSGVFAGDVIKAHRAGCAEFARLYSLPVEYQADIVIASPGGYPADINLLQSHKSMVNASRALKPGGILILAAGCSEGFSLSDYPDFMREHTRGEMRSRLMDNYEILGGTTDNLMSITEKFKVFLISGLDGETLTTLGVKALDIESVSWDEVFDGLDSNSKCYIMPNASKYLPVIAGE